MDEYRMYLRKRGKKEHVIEGLVQSVARFNAFLQDWMGRDLQSAGVEDIERYAGWLEESEKGSASKAVRGIALYYAMTGDQAMKSTANAIREGSIAESRREFSLREFRGVDDHFVEQLESAGISSAQKLIEAGRTPALRMELSRKTGVPLDAILEYVKLSDLSRIEGLKGVRARLYYDVGVDTLDKLAGWDPEELRVMLVDFVVRTDFSGIAPLPKEVLHTVDRAKGIERIVEYV